MKATGKYDSTEIKVAFEAEIDTFRPDRRLFPPSADIRDGTLEVVSLEILGVALDLHDLPTSLQKEIRHLSEEVDFE